MGPGETTIQVIAAGLQVGRENEPTRGADNDPNYEADQKHHRRLLSRWFAIDAKTCEP